MRSQLIKRIRDMTNDIYNAANNKAEFFIEEGEKILEDYLAQYPQDIEIWLRLACFLLVIPVVDVEKSIECINKALIYEHNNVDALLFLALVNVVHLGKLECELFNRLASLEVKDRQYKSMILYVMSWRYRWHSEGSDYENLLLQSIQVCNFHVYNYRDLARYYFKHNQKEKGKELIKTALSNIQAVYSEDINRADLSSYKEGFNEFIKGIHLTRPNVDFIKEDLEQYNLP